eukprot:TRINITY_DN1564_c0_g1_i1.p1 TRINITY_DN1564_c0_g1~~TRINITY_DN1564_c0_g1_i1.p1  ORF type:complete len:321 (+),score=64.12 TRINITY_DN1564_c0_g1_i1:315-1277(+)
MEHYDSQGLIFKNQETTECKSVSLDHHSCDKFQQNLQSYGFSKFRIGFLYGSFSPSGDVTVDFIYEPPQENTPTDFHLKPSSSDELAKVGKLAEFLNLKRVGWIFGRPNREEMFLSKEILCATKFRVDAEDMYGPEGKLFVNVVVSQTDEGYSNFEAFQVTDQAVKLYRSKLFTDQKGGSVGDPEVATTKSAEFIKVNDNVLLFTQGGGKQEKKELESVLFVKPIALKPDYKGKLGTEFPIENREEAPQTGEILKRYMGGKLNSGSFVKIVADFHLLLYLANKYFDISDPTIAEICKAINNGSGDLEGAKLLILSYAGLS